METALPTGKDLIESIQQDHFINSFCPICNESILSVGLNELLYQFDPCNCDAAAYTHLVEVVYHRKCYLKTNTPADAGKD